MLNNGGKKCVLFKLNLQHSANPGMIHHRHNCQRPCLLYTTLSVEHANMRASIIFSFNAHSNAFVG